MDIKKANVNLLLRAMRVYLNSVPREARQGKKYVEAKKALARLTKIFAGKSGELRIVACRKNIPIFDL